MKRMCLVASLAAIAFVCTGNTSAALIGVVQTFPNVALDNSYIIYDHNGIDANTGLFRVVSTGSALNTAPGATAPGQLYEGNGDAVADVMLSVQLNNVTGAFEGGNVSITTGNPDLINPTAPQFSWSGTISEIGFLDNGTQFDARWTLNNDQYQNLPSGSIQLANGLYSGRGGGIKISNGAGLAGNFIETGLMSRDWILGAGVTNISAPANIAAFLTGLNAENGKIQLDSSVQANIFVLPPPQPVPLPGAMWLMMGGLGMLFSFARKNGQG